MTNEAYVKLIKEMTLEGLLHEVMTNPEYLPDSYYHDFRKALYARYEDLLKEKP